MYFTTTSVQHQHGCTTPARRDNMGGGNGLVIAMECGVYKVSVCHIGDHCVLNLEL